MLSEAIRKIVVKENLSAEEAEKAMNVIMSGECLPSQIGAFLMGLRMKGESIEEITGCARSMKQHAKSFSHNFDKCAGDKTLLIDTCGTGGDGANTFNISTSVSIIAAAGGVKVAKHGNRAVSSKSGSADVLSELGFDIEMETADSEQCLKRTGMTFLFAQKYHPAMKYAGPVRRELGTRTIFNILGPLTNPADIKGQVLGVFDGNLTHPLAEVLLRLGRERSLVVHGNDGLDEITVTSETIVSEVKGGKVIDYTINPLDFGMPFHPIEEIKGGNAKENAAIVLSILQGEKGPRRNITVLNSAAALYVGKAADSLKDGVNLAEELIDSGKAYKKLQEIINFSKGGSNDFR